MGWVLVLLVATAVVVGIDDAPLPKSITMEPTPTLPPEEAKHIILKKR
jgi:hypothetical protein